MTPGTDTSAAPRLGRPLVVVVFVALAAVVVAGTTQVWATAEFAGGAGARPVTLDLDGTSLARPAVALALVVGAAALALTVARRRTARVILAGIAAAGAAVTWTCAAPVLHPAQAVRPHLAEQAGLTTGSVPVDQVQVSLTVWPWLCIPAGLLVVLVAVAAWPASRGWGSSARFDSGRAPAADTPDPAGTWDALSDGRDPTR